MTTTMQVVSFIDEMVKQGITKMYYTSDKYFVALINGILGDARIKSMQCVDESSAIAMAVGDRLAGSKPLVLISGDGIVKAVDALISMALPYSLKINVMADKGTYTTSSVDIQRATLFNSLPEFLNTAHLGIKEIENDVAALSQLQFYNPVVPPATPTQTVYIHDSFVELPCEERCKTYPTIKIGTVKDSVIDGTLDATKCYLLLHTKTVKLVLSATDANYRTFDVYEADLTQLPGVENRVFSVGVVTNPTLFIELPLKADLKALSTNEDSVFKRSRFLTILNKFDKKSAFFLAPGPLMNEAYTLMTKTLNHYSVTSANRVIDMATSFARETTTKKDIFVVSNIAQFAGGIGNLLTAINNIDLGLNADEEEKTLTYIVFNNRVVEASGGRYCEASKYSLAKIFNAFQTANNRFSTYKVNNPDGLEAIIKIPDKVKFIEVDCLESDVVAAPSQTIIKNIAGFAN